MKEQPVVVISSTARDLPPFDASRHEPMPDVEINPPDEFGDE